MAGSKTMSQGQSMSLWLAHFMSFVSLALTLYWVYGGSTGALFLGGTDWDSSSKLLFNYHPIFMVAGLVVSYTQGLLAYRTYSFGKDLNKALHGFFAILAIVFTCIGLYAVFKYHNAYLLANLYSTHSWVGIAVVTLFFAQYLGGFLAYGLSLVPMEAKKKYMPRHMFLGIFIYVAAAFTCILGVQDKNSQLGCGYTITLTEPDYNPAAHYSDIYAGCRVSNGLAIAIFVTCLLATYAVLDIDIKSAGDEKQAPLLHAADAGTA